MNGLSPGAKALIEQARPDEEPVPADLDRVMRGARRRLLMASCVTVLFGAGRRAAALGTSAKGAIVATGVAAAVGAGVVTVEPQSPKPPAAPTPAVVVEANPAIPPEEQPSATEPEAEPEVELPAKALPPAVKQPKPARALPRVPGPPKPMAKSQSEPERQSVTQASSLRAEAALLARAQQALASGQDAKSQALLEEYDREHGAGALQAEREGLEVLSLCAAGKTAAARRRAARFVRRYPKSPLRPRIERSCL